MFILIGNLEDYGFEENKDLRTQHTRTFIYKEEKSCSGQYYYNFDFNVDSDNILTFDTDAYGLNEYDLTGFAKIFFKLISKGIIKYKEKK